MVKMVTTDNSNNGDNDGDVYDNDDGLMVIFTQCLIMKL